MQYGERAGVRGGGLLYAYPIHGERQIRGMERLGWRRAKKRELQTWPLSEVGFSPVMVFP